MTTSDELKKTAKKFSEEKLVDILSASNYFIALSGSASYGFADELSDIEMEIYTDKPELHKKIKKILDDCPIFDKKEFSAGVTEWPIKELLNNQFKPNLNNNLYFYYEINKAYPLIDPTNILINAQKNLGYFSDQDRKRLARGLYLEIFELGLHLTKKLMKRNQAIEARIAFYHSVESLARLVHVLNKEYFPHTKWLIKNISTLNNDFSLNAFLKEIETNTDLNQNFDSFSSYMGKFKTEKILSSFFSQEEMDSPWSMLYDRDSYKFITTVMY